MLIVENTAAVVVFVLWVAGFALGYALQNWTDSALAEFFEGYPNGDRTSRTSDRR